MKVRLFNISVKLSFPRKLNLEIRTEKVYYLDEKGNKKYLNLVLIQNTRGLKLENNDILKIERILNKLVFLTYADLLHGEFNITVLDVEVPDNIKKLICEGRITDREVGTSRRYVMNLFLRKDEYEVKQVKIL